MRFNPISTFLRANFYDHFSSFFFLANSNEQKIQKFTENPIGKDVRFWSVRKKKLVVWVRGFNGVKTSIYRSMYIFFREVFGSFEWKLRNFLEKSRKNFYCILFSSFQNKYLFKTGVILSVLIGTSYDYSTFFFHFIFWIPLQDYHQMY